MTKKKFQFLFTPILVLSLAACNNNDSAMDIGYPDANNITNQSTVDRSYVNQVNYREDGLKREGPLAEDRDYGLFDHRGPLTENYVTLTPINYEQRNRHVENNQVGIKPSTRSIKAYSQQVVDLTNEQRRKYGLSDLQIDPRLAQVAQKKSIDMHQNDFFSHTSPTNGSSFDMLKELNVSYRTAGENIAQGQKTPEEVVHTWMNNKSQRRNMLNPHFTHIGVGYEQHGHHWTQLFIKK